MILLDTGPLVAAINRRDRQHQACRKLLESRAGELLVTPYVIAEVCWMVSSRIGATAEANVVDAVAADELRQVTIGDDELRASPNCCTNTPNCTTGRASASPMHP